MPTLGWSVVNRRSVHVSFVSQHRVAEIRRLTWPAHPEVVKSLCALTSVTVCEGRLIARRFFFSFLQST
eukprot:s4554_g5.t1